MAFTFNRIREMFSGVKPDSGEGHNGKLVDPNINGYDFQDIAKKENSKDIYILDCSAPLMNVNTEYLKGYDYWYALGEKYGINRSVSEKTAEYVAHVSGYMAECVEQERARRPQFEKSLEQSKSPEQNDKAENITKTGSSNDGINNSSQSSNDTRSGEKPQAESEKEKNKQSSEVNNSVPNINHAEDVHDEEELKKIKEKRDKYEQKLNEIRDLKSRMVRTYWNGLTDEINHLLYKIFRSLKAELESLLDGHQDKQVSEESALKFMDHSDGAEAREEKDNENDDTQPFVNLYSNGADTNEEKYRKGVHAKTVVDSYKYVYESVDEIKKKIKHEEEVDGYAFYKTRLMIFLMLLGLFSGVFVELAFMSEYTGKALNTGSLYDVMGHYQDELKEAISDAKGPNAKGEFDYGEFIFLFPVKNFIKAHFIFFFSLLPFVFGFVVKIWLDQINQKEHVDDKIKENNEETNRAIMGIAWKPFRSFTANDKVMFVFILILILYTLALGVIISSKNNSFSLGLYATMLSLGLMTSLGLIMHNLVKTYSRYKTISKKGFFKRNSLEYALDKEREEVSALLEKIDKQVRVQSNSKLRDDKEIADSVKSEDNKSDERKSDNTSNNKTAMGNEAKSKKGADYSDDDEELADDAQRNQSTNSNATKKIVNNNTKASDAQIRIQGYVKSCQGAFNAGYEYGKALDARGEIDKEYLEKNDLEDIAEIQHKYDKFKKLFDDKIKNNSGELNG